jgi:hypothetical protein
MKYYIVSKQVSALFHHHSTNLRQSDIQFLPDGRVRFPLEDETAERLEANRRPNETDDQLFFRILGGRIN